jgi:hypothetical protein
VNLTVNAADITLKYLRRCVILRKRRAPLSEWPTHRRPQNIFGYAGDLQLRLAVKAMAPWTFIFDRTNPAIGSHI